MTTLTIDGNGRITLPVATAKTCGSGGVTLVSHSRHHLLLAPVAAAGEVVLAGVLGDLAIPDLLSFLNMFRKTGVLRFELAGGSKELCFQQGELIHATSTFPEEDLGEVLFGLGKVDRETLQKLRSVATSGELLGRALVASGHLSAQDLWAAAQAQAEMIVYGLFTFAEGGFCFFNRPVDGSQTKISLSTQNLIMEGLRRIDEKALFMVRLRSYDAVPALTDKAGEGLPAAEQRLLELVRPGKLPLREILRKSGLGDFQGLRLLYQLSEKGLLRVAEAPTVVVTGELGNILTIFNGALATLYRQIVSRQPDFAQELRLFIRDLPQPYSFVFRDTALLADGSVEGGRILANLEGLEEGDKKKLLADALNELLFMECLAARRELGAAESAELVQRVQDICRRVKGLTGRNE